ncbi:hypothetical protein MSG28_001264 [Choristoneura fumiferana]|uniref:Uncharacterized protein n=1 Tax=Choristoneura fumiferana TaxID=7141 RepID=A0ACC0K444_CHOFU|nr:hypothetical protein MSG28_001264 [Choristoneura fumiferana]
MFAACSPRGRIWTKPSASMSSRGPRQPACGRSTNVKSAQQCCYETRRSSVVDYVHACTGDWEILGRRRALEPFYFAKDEINCILIADNLVVKVSDFGTSREWNDVSAIMSFTGTVAWMAPEVIRHEPCSERVDVWSFGVVLWELLTQEVPYKNMETHAIMWGVGTDTISLPVPATVPDSMQLLLTQCWNRVPKNRPPFKIIAAHLEIAGEEFVDIHDENFNMTQAGWKREVQESMEQLYTKSEKNSPIDIQETTTQRRDELKHARDIRQVYEKQLARANELYMDACAVRLQLEQRESALAEREKALKACRCGVRKFKYQRQTSSSSDGKCQLEPVHRRKKKRDTVLANEKEQVKTYLMDMEQETQNNNEGKEVETVVEQNGNIGLKDAINDNYYPDVAQV